MGEVLISCALLTVLTGMLTFAWTRGARSWLSASKLSTRLSQIQVLKHRVEVELCGSSADGVDCQPAILSFPSAYGLRGTPEAESYFRVSGGTAPLWRKYCLYYWDSANQQVLTREIPIPTGSSAERQALGLSLADVGSGAQPLATYATGGKVLAEQVSRFEVQQEDLMVQLTVETTEAYHGQTNRTLHVVSSTLVRN